MVFVKLNLLWYFRDLWLKYWKLKVEFLIWKLNFCDEICTNRSFNIWFNWSIFHGYISLLLESRLGPTICLEFLKWKSKAKIEYRLNFFIWHLLTSHISVVQIRKKLWKWSNISFRTNLKTPSSIMNLLSWFILATIRPDFLSTKKIWQWETCFLSSSFDLLTLILEKSKQMLISEQDRYVLTSGALKGG